VLDADGLNLLAVEPELWETSLLTAPNRQVVITPHPAEMSRLSGISVAEILADPVSVAVDFACERGVTVVLKDAHTVVASPEGQVFICAAGNAGMAKGGSGDALAGVIGALLAQNRHRMGRDITAAEVAAAGVYLHARAGDLTAEALGEYGMLASDLIERIPLVCKGFSDSRTRLYV
jgi:NAD(P)H-hydrate epimerase